jgi:glycosyltransferase involved in cell wall biosynthesis
LPPGQLHRRWRQLAEAGIGINSFSVGPLGRSVIDAIHRFIPAIFKPSKRLHHLALATRVRFLNPELVVISQGQAFDGCYPIGLPEICRLAKVPYVLICNKAAEIHWPDDRIQALLRQSFQESTMIYFVSHHNQKLVSHQLAIDLSASMVVHNPFLVCYHSDLPWPPSSDGLFQLACVARMWPLEKGQDILLTVLAMDKWRQRPLVVNFFGDGPMAEGLQNMARHLQLERVGFPGFTDPETIWRQHHGLVLPSRAEGLPLAQVEAMLCGRPVIVADAGGTAEILVDGVQGFLARSASVVELDAALERAWQRRHDWPAIGQAAADHIRSIYPPDPCAVFADQLEALLRQRRRPAV